MDHFTIRCSTNNFSEYYLQLRHAKTMVIVWLSTRFTLVCSTRVPALFSTIAVTSIASFDVSVRSKRTSPLSGAYSDWRPETSSSDLYLGSGLPPQEESETFSKRPTHLLFPVFSRVYQPAAHVEPSCVKLGRLQHKPCLASHAAAQLEPSVTDTLRSAVTKFDAHQIRRYTIYKRVVAHFIHRHRQCVIELVSHFPPSHLLHHSPSHLPLSNANCKYYCRIRYAIEYWFLAVNFYRVLALVVSLLLRSVLHTVRQERANNRCFNISFNINWRR